MRCIMQIYWHLGIITIIIHLYPLYFESFILYAWVLLTRHVILREPMRYIKTTLLFQSQGIQNNMIVAQRRKAINQLYSYIPRINK